MKKCPQCQSDYFDERLEYCLEDGTKLIEAGRQSAVATENFSIGQKSVETMFASGRADIPKTVEVTDKATAVQQTPATEQVSTFKQKAVEKGYRAMEIGTLVSALALNWWQWLYVDRQSYGSVSNFFFSIEFWIWFLLFVVGITLGVLTLKFSRKKEMALVGLIILAVNFLLLIVPKK